MRRRSAQFLKAFWDAASLAEVARYLDDHAPSESFAYLTQHAMTAARHHAAYGVHRLHEAGTAAEFLTRSMRRVIDEETTRLEWGLTVLATVGSTAPFVGLFGTVWGVYHALVAIGMSGAGTLDQVAGPVGEALIMTGLGLAVAIPAVLGYNVFTRANRVLAARLDAFATSCSPSSPRAHPSRRASGRRGDAAISRRSLSMAFGSFDHNRAPARRWPRSTWCR